MKTIKHLKRWLSALLAALMLLLSCGAAAEGIIPEGQRTLKDLEAFGATACLHDDRVTFVEGACTDRAVQSMADARQVVDSMVNLLGGDARTQFEPWREIKDTAGNRYYVFQQMYAETTVLGGAVKVVTDADGQMLGLVGSVESELPDIEASEGITAEAAEALAVQHMADAGFPQVQLIEGRTEKVILPVELELDMEDENYDESSRFVWAVYTDNPGGSVTRGSDLPYLAHYVTMDGVYLYSLPTVMPGDEAATAGYDAAYVFEFMEPADYTGTVKLSDGTEQEITVTLMRDARTGMYYLGNIERRIAVADCYEMLYGGGRVVLEASRDNTGWDDTCLLSLYNYCRAWDYYHDIGWNGGDGLGTPMLILKDFCNKNHDPIDNAAYAGKYYGWQLFLSSTINDFSQCLDVLAHEFTHCVTGSVMTYNAYMNDYGAINEAMSDIQGNLCEMMMGATEDTTWSVGEMSRGAPVRSMSDPQSYGQPAFAWDLHYVPKVKVPTELNDQGGVHNNSSLLNNVAYRLCTDGGMTMEEARAYWFAADCAMVPGTDYAQMSELLPWVMKNLGLEKYLNALEQAMDYTRIRSDAMPEVFDNDRALVTLTLPDQEIFMDGHWQMLIVSINTEEIARRFNAIMAQEGEYADALDELADAVFGIDQGTGTDNRTSEEALDRVFDAIIQWLDTPEAESEVPTSDAPESVEPEDVDKSVIGRVFAWFRKYFQDTVYGGLGSAGQDGRTMRMVCRPGYTLPVLFRLEIDANYDIQSAGLAVYTMKKWIDLGSMAKDILKDMENLDASSDDTADLSWLDLLFPNEEVNEEAVDDSVSMEKVEELLDTIKSMRWFLDLLFFEIAPGSITEIPAAGLEGVTVLESDFIKTVLGNTNLLEILQVPDEEEASAA